MGKQRRTIRRMKEILRQIKQHFVVYIVPHFLENVNYLKHYFQNIQKKNAARIVKRETKNKKIKFRVPGERSAFF